MKRAGWSGGHGLGLSRTLCGMRTCKIFALSVKTVVYGQSPVQVTPSTLAFNKSGYDVADLMRDAEKLDGLSPTTIANRLSR